MFLVLSEETEIVSNILNVSLQVNSVGKRKVRVYFFGDFMVTVVAFYGKL
jgi:hypothetical protein